MIQVFTDDQLTKLNTPLNREEIKTKNISGNSVSYLKGNVAIDKANRIFGPGLWGYRIVSDFTTEDTGVKNGKGASIYLVSVQVELTVVGCVPIVENGDCEAQGTSAAAMSMARKGAVTDGLKRCLKNYGPAFGLELYGELPDSEEQVENSTAARTPAALQPRQNALQGSVTPIANSDSGQRQNGASQANTARQPIANSNNPKSLQMGQGRCPKCDGPANHMLGIKEGKVWDGYFCQDTTCKERHYLHLLPGYRYPQEAESYLRQNGIDPNGPAPAK